LCIDFLSIFFQFGSLSLLAAENILKLHSFYQAAMLSKNDSVCLRICWIVGGFAENNAHNLARETQFCTQFSEFLLLILSHPNKQIAQNAFLYFAKLGLFMSSEKQMFARFFNSALEQIVRHVFAVDEEIPQKYQHGLGVILLLDNDDKPTEYSDELELYLDFLQTSGPVIESICSGLRIDFYRQLLLLCQTPALIESALLVASFTEKVYFQNPVAVSEIEQLFRYALSIPNSCSSLLFIRKIFQVVKYLVRVLTVSIL
jgi:hypothetical protein